MLSCPSCGAPAFAEARFCSACGAALHGAGQQEERKLATVLFADLVGSTALASDEDPERVRALLDRFYEAMAREIESRGGTVEKFAGDAVMAVFGAPIALEDHAERALHAALAMQRRQGEIFAGLGLRIGVNTGEVVAGALRGETGYVTGDAVNVGARLEQAAEPGEVLAGERTVAAARGAFEFGERRVVEAKGKPGGVPGYPTLRALSLARPRGVGGLQRAFVGRDAEVELLHATYRRAVSRGEPHLVTVLGEPGIGKTRLIEELWTLLAGEEGPPLRLSGGCLPYGDGITYWPIGEIVRDWFGIREDDSFESVALALGDRAILALALGLDAAHDIHPLDAREQLHAAFVDVCRELVVDRPLVLVVEDVHWAEDDLVMLLERVVREVRGPLLLAATGRPELLDVRPSWGGGRRNATTIWLEPLPPDATSRMLEQLLAVDLPDRLQELVVERAEGNPFFVEELVGALIDGGVLHRETAGWTAAEVPEGFSVPDTVHAVLAARIDDLPGTEKAALQAASVIGQTFSPSAVRHLVGGELPDFALLEERDLVRSGASSSGAGEQELSLKHALIVDVAYAGIPKARRPHLHAAFADWLVAEGRALDEHASLLAFHYGEAARPDNADLAWSGRIDELARVREHAVHWLRRAGVLARSRHEMGEATELLERAVGLADEPREQAELWFEVGLTRALVYDGDGFWAAMQRGLELEAVDRETEARAYAQLAFQTAMRSGMWLNRPDLDELPRWVERAVELSAPDSRARAEALLASAFYHRPDDEQLGIDAEAIAERLHDVTLRSYALGARSGAAFVAGRFQDAATLAEERLGLLDGVDMLDHHCDAYESMIPILIAVGRFDAAREIARRHGEAAARLSPHHRLHAQAVKAEIAENVGDWAAGRELTEAAVAAVEANVGTPCVRGPRTLVACGLAHSAAGDDARADELFAVAARLAGQGWDPYLNPLWLRLALIRRKPEEVERLVDAPFERDFVFGPSQAGARYDALALLRRREAVEALAPRSLQPGSYLEPFALRALGIVRSDDDLLAQADGRFVALGLEWHRAQAESLLAGL